MYPRIPWDLVGDRLGSVEHILGTMTDWVIYGNRIAIMPLMVTNVSE